MPRSVLICDFDNTLYDWVGYFVPSFYEMVDVAAEILGCDRDTLLSDFRRVHQAHGDSEHPFSLLETETVLRAFPNKDRAYVAEALDEAFHAFNRARKKHLRLYDGVLATLKVLDGCGIRIIGHTEARPLAVRDRLNRLGLSEFFPRVYCRERALVHQAVRKEERTEGPELIELSHHQQKPSPTVLLEICEREGIAAESAVYVGDSLFKDISMANAARVFAVWVKFGANVDPKFYANLVAISHWSDDDVEHARKFAHSERPAHPDFILESSFAEIQRVFEDSIGVVQLASRTA
ncbi:MAG: HAD-IA family hydrolase [Sphingomonas sp.]|nr:HAD-IA family hydrolase [Sphingomonas sp.]